MGIFIFRALANIIEKQWDSNKYFFHHLFKILNDIHICNIIWYIMLWKKLLLDCQNFSFLLFLEHANIYQVKNWNMFDSGQWSCTCVLLLYTCNPKLLKCERQWSIWGKPCAIQVHFACQFRKKHDQQAFIVCGFEKQKSFWSGRDNKFSSQIPLSASAKVGKWWRSARRLWKKGSCRQPTKAAHYARQLHQFFISSAKLPTFYIL